MRYLIILLLSVLWPFCLNAQDKALVFSLQKDLYYGWDRYTGAHIAYNKFFESNPNYYYFIRTGFRSLETFNLNPEEIELERNHIVLDPDLEFTLWGYVSVDPLITQTGRSQLPSSLFVRQTIPLGIGIGREWLKDYEKIGLFTDVGMGIAYAHSVAYAWGELINIEGIEPPGQLPYFTMLGKAISREIRTLVDIYVDFSYYLFKNLGIGVNLSISGVVNYETFHQWGFHLRYIY